MVPCEAWWVAWEGEGLPVFDIAIFQCMMQLLRASRSIIGSSTSVIARRGLLPHSNCRLCPSLPTAGART